MSALMSASNPPPSKSRDSAHAFPFAPGTLVIGGHCGPGGKETYFTPCFIPPWKFFTDPEIFHPDADLKFFMAEIKWPGARAGERSVAAE